MSLYEDLKSKMNEAKSALAKPSRIDGWGGEDFMGIDLDGGVTVVRYDPDADSEKPYRVLVHEGRGWKLRDAFKTAALLAAHLLKKGLADADASAIEDELAYYARKVDQVRE